MKRADLEAALRAGVVQALKELPEDIDTTLVVDAVMTAWGDSSMPSLWHIARNGQALPEPVIRGVLERLKTVKQRGHAVFLLEAVRTSTEPLQAAWAGALRAYLEVEVAPEAWGAKLVRERVAKCAKSSFLPAVQAAVVAGRDVPIRFLAVLAHDGSEASLDALLKVISEAVADARVGLGRLRMLRTHAADTPELAAFFEVVERTGARRAETSGVLDFARSIGFDVDVLDVRVSLHSVEHNKHNVPAVQGSVSFDSASGNWFWVHVSRGGDTTSFGIEKRQDALGLGWCEPAELPQWLAKAEQTLGITWTCAPHLGGSLKGKKRQAFLDWVFSASRRVTETPHVAHSADAKKSRR